LFAAAIIIGYITYPRRPLQIPPSVARSNSPSRE
jgi:hypothetical protein